MISHPRRIATSAVFGLLALWSCAAADDETPPAAASGRMAIESTAPEASFRVEPRTIEIGTSVEGRPIVATIHGHTGPSILFMATIHGNEWAGTPLLERFEAEIVAAPGWTESRRIVLIRVANPDGFAMQRRTNSRGVDLNRNFPADNFTESSRHGGTPLSEPESKALADFLAAEKPAAILSIHQPLACIDWDGEAEVLARAMSAVSPLAAKKLGGRPGSLGSWAGLTLGIPIVTFEMRAGDEKLSAEALWRLHGPALLAFLSAVEHRGHGTNGEAGAAPERSGGR